MKPIDPDGSLLEKARGGDYQAFESLVDRHGGRLFGLALGVLRQREDAEDVVQTSFMNALEHLAGFRGDSTFATWITRITLNNALKHLRKRRGLETVPLDAPEMADASEIPHPEFIAEWNRDPLQALEHRELHELLEGAMDGLSEGQRLVFVLRDLQGQSVEETAQALGITASNVKVRLLRARLALREELTRAFGYGSRQLTHPEARP